MRYQLPLQGKSQYGSSILPNYRNSACGPTTVHVILQYLGIATPTVNDLYEALGCTKIGLFRWRLIHNLRKLLPTWDIRACSLKVAMQEIDAGRPVAIRFDRYFSLQWRDKKSAYAYHWVPLIGYEIHNGTLSLIFHDNGGRNRDSEIRITDYKDNEKVLSFVKIAPKQENTKNVPASQLM
ncbi:C39 family peptidase [Lysinibacillus sp. NPDC097287]|uniref:C39 family peptidase n=1 Tax=Lysinibacillus sp. NPDC097287 TaxID=3364144 RepID=UPI0038225B58